MFIFELEGDKIARIREYDDTARVFDTLRAGERRQRRSLRLLAN
jgi:limonene-1,2-epoxide hydrolase